MAKTKISEFSTTPGNNTDINGINIAEGCAPSGINNAIRELMSDLKEWQSGAMDVYVIPQGTAAAPGIQLYGDLDTGLYGYAANQLGVAVGGASAGYFSSAGWVGNVNGTITGDINATTIDTTNIEVTNIKAKDGTAAITIADSTGVVSVSTQLAVDNLNLSGNTLSSSDTNGNIILAPNGTGDVYLDADTIRVGDSNTNVTITSNGTADLILNTNSGTNSGSITIQDGVNGNILIATNGTGQIQLTGDLDVANIETGAIKARDGTASATIADSTGVMTIASSVLTTTDINGGTIDGTTIGGSTAAAGTFTTATATTGNITTVNATTVDTTNIEVTNIKAKDGTAALSIADSTGVVSVSANPVLSGGTANGVLYLNASKAVTSGTALTFDGTNLGIGASTPSSKLDLGGTVSSTEQIRFSMGGNVAWIGSVGSGTANGLGNLTFWTRDGSSAVVRYQIDGSGQSIWSVAGSEQMRLTSTGLGIGESSPAYKLDVAATKAVTRTTSTTGTNGAFSIWANTGGSFYFGLDNSAGTEFSAAYSGAIWHTGAYPLVFATSNTERMRLDSSGNLGLGTATTTNGRLNVQAGTAATGNSAFFSNPDGTYNPYLQIQHSSAGVKLFNGSSYGAASNNLIFGNGGTSETMRIDGSGNLGLGVTPSAWGSGRTAIQVYGSSTAAYFAGGTFNTYFSTNYYFNSGDKFIGAANYASFYTQSYLGQHQWWTSSAASSGADSTATMSQLMTLDASGNLSVGTTSNLLSAASRVTVSVNGTSSSAIAFGVGDTRRGHIYVDGTETVFAAGQNGQSQIMALQVNGAERARITSGGDFRVKGAGTAGSTDAFQISGSAPADAARLTSGGDLLVGTTSGSDKIVVEQSASASASLFINSSGTAGAQCVNAWHKNTTGDNVFLQFFTEASATSRGSISYNRTAGLVAYNTTSDYRAKDILGPVANSGATIDALKVYEGKMKGAAQSRPMLVAHEAQEHAPYAVTGEKDAVNEDGTPKYQQMDVSSLVPLLLAEIQSLRARVAQLEGK